jgi:hypothetical protein
MKNEIIVKELNGQRVVTFKDIDEQHERPAGIAKKNFDNNKKRFIIGEDYFEVSRKEFGENFSPNSKMKGNPNLKTILITESGYLMIAKSFTDDLSWEIQRSLVNGYFAVKKFSQAVIKPDSTLADLQNKIELLMTASQNSEQHLSKLFSMVDKCTGDVAQIKTAVENNKYLLWNVKNAVASANL